MPAFPRLVSATLLAFALIVAPVLGATVVATDEIVVRQGDTLTAISKRHGVAVSTLVSINGIANPNRIYVGQRLQLSTTTPAAPAPAPVADGPAPGPALVHTVRPGDNLWSIARFYGVSLSALVAANGIGNASRIHPGRQLSIPGAAPVSAPAAPVPDPATPEPPAPSEAAPSQQLVHTVRAGDNLWSIARFYGVSLSALVTANGIGNASRIHPGQQLSIPGAAPVAPAPGPAPAPAPAPPAAAMPAGMAVVVAQRDAMRQLITEQATNAGVPVSLALAVAWQESGWRQNVVSSAGAVGVMQLMPGTAQWVGQSMLGRPVDINDARDNVHAGVRLLAHYLNRYGGNRDLVLAAYFQGQGSADRHGVYPVSRAYIASVNALVLLFGG